MALSSDEQRRCFKHCGYIMVNRTGAFVGGQPMTTELVQVLQTALDNITPNGETTVRADYLPLLDAQWTELAACRTRMQASVAGKVTLNPQEYEQRKRQYDDLRGDLCRLLNVPMDPYEALLAADGSQAGGGAQGPWREP